MQIGFICICLCVIGGILMCILIIVMLVVPRPFWKTTSSGRHQVSLIKYSRRARVHFDIDSVLGRCQSKLDFSTFWNGFKFARIFDKDITGPPYKSLDCAIPKNFKEEKKNTLKT